MQISPQLIDEVLQKTSIVDIVSEYVELEKKGKNYVGLCPFHGDTNPSMSVSEEKKIFKCFSCGAGGNAIKFVQDFEKISFVEATKKVASKVGITLDIKESRFKKYHKINQEASDFYGFYLNNTPEGTSIKSYLQTRGISNETIKQFEIGFAPEGNLLYKSLRNKQIEPLDIITTGLAHKHENNYFDTFRRRIMFPIWDSSGNIVGFSGRTVGKTDQAKYVNSSESSLFKKGDILYNFHKAMNSIKNKGRVILMEGFMDVIAAHNAGVEEAVATMGTALTENHIKLLKRVTNKVIICFDGDQPGQDAAYKSLKHLREFDVRVVSLPNGQDPDDFIKSNSAEEFRKEIDNAKDIISFIFDYNLSKVNRNSVHELEQFKKAIFSLIESSSNVQIELFLNRLSQELNVSYASIYNDFNTRKNKTESTQHKQVVKQKYFKAEATIISIMLTDKDHALKLRKRIENKEIDATNSRLIDELMKYYRTHSQFNSKIFFEQLPKPLLDHFISNNFMETKFISEKQIDDCIKVIDEYHAEQKRIYIMNAMQNASDEEKLQLLAELKKVNIQIKGAGNNE